MPLQLIPSIHRVTHQIGLFLERAADLRVTQAEAHILAHLAEHGADTVAELHRALAHKRSTLTSILDRLTARRLVTRKVSPRDRRSFVIALTAEGARLAGRVLASLEALEAAATAGQGDPEIRALQGLLTRLEASARPAGGSEAE
jgi:DNA-binding MarR family transcriptional regulator